MATNLDAQVNNVVDSLAKQRLTSLDGLGFGILNKTEQTNVVNLKQDVFNKLAQIIDNTCSASSVQNIQGNLIYARNSNIGGNIGFTQDSEVSASCIMNSVAKMQLSNKLSSTVDQAATAIDAFGLIIMIVIFGGIAFLFFRLFKGRK
jgi:hypothetical protein